MTRTFCLTLFLVICWVQPIYPQTPKAENRTINSELDSLLNKPYSSTEEGLLRGDSLMNLAHTKNERMRVYWFLADMKNKQEEYLESIQYFEKARLLANETGDKFGTFLISVLITQSYRYTGLMERAAEEWEKTLKLAKDMNDKSGLVQFYINQNMIAALGGEKKYCETIPILKECLAFVNQEMPRPAQFSAVYATMAYSLLKCGDYKTAGMYIAKNDSILAKNKDHRQFFNLQSHYLGKALFEKHRGNDTSASRYMTEALVLAKEQKNARVMNNLIEDALVSEIEFKKQIYDEYFLSSLIENNKKKLEESSKITNYESKRVTELARINEAKKNKLFLALTFLAVCTICFLIYQNFTKKRTIKRFEQIVQGLQREADIEVVLQQIELPEEQPVSESNPEISKISESKIMSYEKEIALLKKLEKFEKGDKFAEKNFTISHLATILDTNSKYINYIISRRHNKNFNDYLNHLRITYITQKIYTNLEFREYKISYLAELCGFSNHSHFTLHFKKIQKLSPSEFIGELKKSQVSQDA